MTVEPFEPRRFATAAAHYLAGRLPYADRLIRRTAERTSLTAQDSVLDLGCGPGQLACAFAAFAGSVLGIDPEPEMLRIARARAPANVTFLEASSYGLTPDWGRFRLVTMGRSFHWMDRAETLRRLDPMILPGGAVALFHDTHPDLPENAWWPEYRALIRGFVPPDARAVRRTPGWAGHETVLLDSAFACLEKIAVIERRETTTANLIDRALSMSSTSAAKLGDRTAELTAALRAFLDARAPAGRLTEVVATEALIATRG